MTFPDFTVKFFTNLIWSNLPPPNKGVIFLNFLKISKSSATFKRNSKAGIAYSIIFQLLQTDNVFVHEQPKGYFGKGYWERINTKLYFYCQVAQSFKQRMILKGLYGFEISFKCESVETMVKITFTYKRFHYVVAFGPIMIN